jgi:hypothetical protein
MTGMGWGEWEGVGGNRGFWGEFDAGWGGL